MYKHIILTSLGSTVRLDDNGNPVTTLTKHEAQMDHPVDGLDQFVADAKSRWQTVTILDKCPSDCPAQLATGV